LEIIPDFYSAPCDCLNSSPRPKLAKKSFQIFRPFLFVNKLLHYLNSATDYHQVLFFTVWRRENHHHTLPMMAKTRHDDSTFAEVLLGEASSKRLTPASGAAVKYIRSW
jgi:hypothetical protein